MCVSVSVCLSKYLSTAPAMVNVSRQVQCSPSSRLWSPLRSAASLLSTFLPTSTRCPPHMSHRGGQRWTHVTVSCVCCLPRAVVSCVTMRSSAAGCVWHARRYYKLGSWDYYWQRVDFVVFHPSPVWLNYAPAVLLYRSVVFQVRCYCFCRRCEPLHLACTGRGLPPRATFCP
jgi:hypothetical protein